MKQIFRIFFSWPFGLFVVLFLVLFWAWYLVYRPTIGETRRIEKIAAEFKAHGCRSMRLETVPMFEANPLLAPLNLERKILVQLDFGPGAEVPKEYLRRPPYLPQLVWVGFDETNPTSEEFAWAVSQPNMQFVCVTGNHRIGWEGFRAIPPKKRFCLRLSKDESLEDDLRYLALGGTLESLTLYESRLTEQCFDSISAIPLLALSFLECDGFSVDGFKKLKRLPLVSLMIVNRDHGPPGELTDEMLHEISGMNELQSFSIGFQHQITDAGIDALKKLPNLRHIRGISPDKQAEFGELILKRIESTP